MKDTWEGVVDSVSVTHTQVRSSIVIHIAIRLYIGWRMEDGYIYKVNTVMHLAMDTGKQSHIFILLRMYIRSSLVSLPSVVKHCLHVGTVYRD